LQDAAGPNQIGPDPEGEHHVRASHGSGEK